MSDRLMDSAVKARTRAQWSLGSTMLSALVQISSASWY